MMKFEYKKTKSLIEIQPPYTLKSIDLKTKTANLCCRETLEIIDLPIDSLFFNDSITDKMHPMDAAHIGYHFGLLEKKGEWSVTTCTAKQQVLKRGPLNIAAIGRDKKLILENQSRDLVFSKDALELYKNTFFMKKFSPSQALYIGYLASTLTLPKESIKKNNYSFLRLVK